MAMSKHRLAGFLCKKTLTFERKIKLLDSNNNKKKRKRSCRQLAEQFNIGKTAAAQIIKNEASIRKEYELFKGKLKRKRKGQFHDNNEILYVWSQKCCTANIYPDGPMLKEEAIEIKKCLDPEEFQNFTLKWLEKWKLSYGVRERKVKSEAGEAPECTVCAWMERLLELKVY